MNGPLPSWTIAALAAPALLLAACGGGAPGEPAAAHATDTPAAASNAPSSEGGAASPPPADGTAPALAVPARTDGLSGAPVPAVAAVSSEFAAPRVDARAGSFPPLNYPLLVSAEQATWLGGDDLVLGAVQNGEARAYPLFMMTLHHVANDELGGEPYLGTF